MDPATLAATATTLLAPYLGKIADKAAETLGEKLPGAAGKVWGALTARLKGRPAAEEAAKDLVARPEDADNQASFRKAVRKARWWGEPHPGSSPEPPVSEPAKEPAVYEDLFTNALGTGAHGGS